MRRAEVATRQARHSADSLSDLPLNHIELSESDATNAAALWQFRWRICPGGAVTSTALIAHAAAAATAPLAARRAADFGQEPND